jgi:hypothetical protein
MVYLNNLRTNNYPVNLARHDWIVFKIVKHRLRTLHSKLSKFTYWSHSWDGVTQLLMQVEIVHLSQNPCSLQPATHRYPEPY